MAGSRRARRVDAVRFALVLWAIASGLTTSPAHAETQLQAVVDATLGYTDNARSAPDHPPPGVPAKAADEFLIVSPGAVLAVSTARALHRFGYTYSASLFYENGDANASSHRLDYRGFFELSPRSFLLLGAGVMQTRPYAASTIVPASSDSLNATLPSTAFVIIATTDELLSYEIDPDWRAWQSARAALGTPLRGASGPRTAELGGTLGIERTFRADALGVEERATYDTVSEGVRADGTPTGVVKQLLLESVGLWRHDLGRDFSSRVEAGVLRVERITFHRGFWQPTGLATLMYAVESGQASLTYAHRVTTNLLLGQSLLVDEVRLQGGVPLTSRRELLLGASAGYQRGRLIDDDASLKTRIDVWLADVELGWQVSPSLLASARYQHIDQRSEAEAPPLPLSFVRNAVMLGVDFRLPPEAEMPKIYRAPSRVDRSDELREGYMLPSRRDDR